MCMNIHVVFIRCKFKILRVCEKRRTGLTAGVQPQGDKGVSYDVVFVLKLCSLLTVLSVAFELLLIHNKV